MPTRNHYGVILAGGRGTRFWPKSRKNNPKQLLPFLKERSLIQETLERLRPVIPPERIWVLTSKELRPAVIRQLPEVPARQVVAEPVPRNTAPAIGLAARILASVDQNAVMGVFPSDHHVARSARFRKLVKAAYRGAEAGRLMVLGIEPRWPETGYGYVELPKGTRRGDPQPVAIKRFIEKPDLKTARRFLKAGRYSWNAGIFFWRADRFLDELRQHEPKTWTLLESLPSYGSRVFQKSLREIFPKVDGISVDFAVLERAAEVHGIAADDIGWNDLGSWKALYELLARESGNVSRTDSLIVSGHGNYVDAPGKLVSLLGVDNLIVVDTPDAILIADRNRAQQVKDVVTKLEEMGRSDLL
jgi:mannose-1-phosphate guanylyltransferase